VSEETVAYSQACLQGAISKHCCYNCFSNTYTCFHESIEDSLSRAIARFFGGLCSRPVAGGSLSL
jgi:hypothetical protein